MRVTGRCRYGRVAHPLLDDGHGDARLRQAGGAGVPQHMGHELRVVGHAHVIPQDLPRTAQPVVAAHGEQSPGPAAGQHPAFDDGTYPAHDGHRARVVVLDLPCRQGAPFEVDVPALQTPQFPAAEARVEQAEDGILHVLRGRGFEDAEHPRLFFRGEEADAVFRLPALGHLGHPFQLAPLERRPQDAGQAGQLAVHRAAAVAPLVEQVGHEAVDTVQRDVPHRGVGPEEPKHGPAVDAHGLVCGLAGPDHLHGALCGLRERPVLPAGIIAGPGAVRRRRGRIAERLAGKEGRLQRGGGLGPALAAHGHVHDVAGTVRADAPGRSAKVTEPASIRLMMSSVMSTVAGAESRFCRE